MNNSKHHILFNIDTIFDFNSVLFGVYRGYFANRNYDIQKLKIHIEGFNFENGLKNLIKNIQVTDQNGSAQLSNNQISYSEVVNDIKPYIEQSFYTIKPVIGSYRTLTNLEKNGNPITLFSRFEPAIIDLVKKVHKDWLTYEIQFISNTLSEILTDAQSDKLDGTVVVDSSLTTLQTLINELPQQIKAVLVPNTRSVKAAAERMVEAQEVVEKDQPKVYYKLQDIEWKKLNVEQDLEWPALMYTLQLDTKPTNEEYRLWSNQIKLEKPVSLTSTIVHGFGRGGRQLGIYTANLEITEEIGEKINHLLTGIYYGYATIAEPTDSSKERNPNLSYNKTYKMVMSIGFNPYFENKFKTAEVHLIHKFEGDFYDETLKVDITGFIRNEADFLSFENLLSAIHNDVQLVKDLLP